MEAGKGGLYSERGKKDPFTSKPFRPTSKTVKKGIENYIVINGVIRTYVEVSSQNLQIAPVYTARFHG